VRQHAQQSGEMTRLTKAVDSRDPAVGLAAVAALRSLVEELEALHVDRARAAGWSWEAIATELGITRQSVHKKHHVRRGLRR
jgi:hypothetical protein